MGGTEGARPDNPVCGAEAWVEGEDIYTGRMERHRAAKCELPLGHESQHTMHEPTGAIWEWAHTREDIERAARIFRDRRNRGR